MAEKRPPSTSFSSSSSSSAAAPSSSPSTIDIVPGFKETPIENINDIVRRHHDAFATGKTRPLEFRLTQLRRLYYSLVDHTDAIVAACGADLRKGPFEAALTEAEWLKNDVLYVEENLAKWVKDDSAEDIEFAFKLAKPRIRKEPLGTVLVIGAFNFPFQLSLGPMIGAIAAGCCCVLKPSENSPASAAVLKMIVEDALDPSCYSVVNGGVPQATALLETPLRWDAIFYTGGLKAGKIVAAAAAKTLTPVTLELGGLNPAFVTANADVRLAARRLLWAKGLNAGQVCVSQNWILVDRKVLDSFIKELKIAHKEFYPDGVKASPDYGRIINQPAFDRLVGLLKNTRGEVVLGGETDAETRFIAPTVVVVKDEKDPLVTAETFGPFIPIMPVDTIDEAIKLANGAHETPLAIYPFGSPQEVRTIMDRTRSGGCSINDGLFHASVATLPFGGVGTSGTGCYRGRQSFETFTHRRSVTETPKWFEFLLTVRYPPYTPAKIAQYARMSKREPKFGRDCRPSLLRAGRVWYYLALGASSVKGLVARYAILAVVLAAARARLGAAGGGARL